MNYNLALPFYENSTTDPEAVALFVGKANFSYGDLAGLARRISGWLGLECGPVSGRVGILASRTVEAYAGVLGTLWSGAAYVPINPQTPEDRLVRILQMTKLDALITDQAGLDLLSDRVLKFAPRRILIGPDTKPPANALRFQGTRFESFSEFPGEGPAKPVTVAEDALAYIIFTSGTTGAPKGVMIEAGSVARFRGVVQARCGFLSTDRVSQVAELTFDNSALDMFVTWAAGAGLYVVPASQLMAPAKFIRDHELTIWFSVPSTAVIMQRMKMLKPGAFPSLRCSIFAGEALPMAAAQAWQIAAPNSIVENFYGPTEVTVDCIAQRLEDPPNITRNRGSLAIGKPFPGIQAGIVDAELRFLPAEEEGELVVSGRQVARRLQDKRWRTLLRRRVPPRAMPESYGSTALVQYLFFALSGFLITGILLDTVNSPNFFRTFYARRTLRIFPLYYGVILSLLLFTKPLHFVWSGWQYFYLTYTANLVLWLRGPLILQGTSIDHFWSLQVEEQFYLLWPLILYRVRSLHSLIRVSVVTCIAVLLIHHQFIAFFN